MPTLQQINAHIAANSLDGKLKTIRCPHCLEEQESEWDDTSCCNEQPVYVWVDSEGKFYGRTLEGKWQPWPDEPQPPDNERHK